jgi:hypothetical protein
MSRAPNTRARTTPPLGAASSLVHQLMSAAFDVVRDPRSEAYKLGARELLNCRVHGLKLVCPYKLGTAEADAYFSGADEGHAIWRRYQETRAAGTPATNLPVTK